MKYLIPALLATILLLSTACESQPPPPPPKIVEDVSKEVPDMAKRLFENDYIAATLIELPPRAALPKHRCKDRVVYTMGHYRLREEPEGGDGQVTSITPDERSWRTAEVHTVSNSGATTATYLIVERKQPYPEPEKPSNLVSVARGYAGSVLNNEDVRVVQVSLAGKARIPAHDSSGRLIVALDPMKFRFTEGKEAVTKEFAKGDVHWQEAGSHRAQSLSGDPAKFLVIEFKR